MFEMGLRKKKGLVADAVPTIHAVTSTMSTKRAGDPVTQQPLKRRATAKLYVARVSVYSKK
jgi:hypothetical protein